MSKEKKKIVIIKPTMTIPRYHFNRTLELADEFEITYIINSAMVPFSLEKFCQKNHNIIFLNKPLKKGFIKTTLALIKYYCFVIKYLNNHNFNLIVVDISRMCFLLPIFKGKNNYVLQMYTSSVGKSKFKNLVFDIEKKFNTLFFKKILLGTEWMIREFNLYKKDNYIVKWGTKALSETPKLFNSIRLLYVGTLNNRDIYKTVEGLSIFLNNYKGYDISYDIVGTGNNFEILRLVDTIKSNKLENIVHYHGFVSDDKLPYFFDKCNVGVAYVPVKDYYNNVVATKLYEYFVSGLFSIATKTEENIKIVDSTNGVLIDDSAEGFSYGLEYINSTLTKIDSQQILKASEPFNLRTNAKKHMIPLYYKLINGD